MNFTHEVQILLCVSLTTVSSNTSLFTNGIKRGMNHSPKLTEPRCSRRAILPRFCLRDSFPPFPTSGVTRLSQARTPPFPPIYSQKTSLQQLQQLFSRERSIWEVFNVFLTVSQCSLAAGSQVQSQSKGFILCYCTSCLFPLTSSGKTALPRTPSCSLITRTHRAVSCTAGSEPSPWSGPMIYLNSTDCMFRALRTTDNQELAST